MTKTLQPLTHEEIGAVLRRHERLDWRVCSPLQALRLQLLLEVDLELRGGEVEIEELPEEE